MNCFFIPSACTQILGKCSDKTLVINSLPSCLFRLKLLGWDTVMKSFLIFDSQRWLEQSLQPWCDLLWVLSPCKVLTLDFCLTTIFETCILQKIITQICECTILSSIYPEYIKFAITYYKLAVGGTPLQTLIPWGDYRTLSTVAGSPSAEQPAVRRPCHTFSHLPCSNW